jgi:hypothetical protein
MKTLRRLPLSYVADLNSKPQPRRDSARGSAAIDADAVRVNQSIHLTRMQNLQEIMSRVRLRVARFE